MSMMLMALLAVGLPALQTGTVQTATMQSDMDRLVRAAEGLAGTWPLQPPPPIPEVAIVARHGKAVVPLLMALVSDDPHAERDRRRWKVQQQVALTLSQIYSESQHCGRTYCDGDPPKRIGHVRAGWLNVIASDKEMQDVDYIVPWSLAEIGDRRAIAPFVAQTERDDPSLRCWRSAPSNGCRLARRCQDSDSCCRTTGGPISEIGQRSHRQPNAQSQCSPDDVPWTPPPSCSPSD